jgi:hypothetical protein
MNKRLLPAQRLPAQLLVAHISPDKSDAALQIMRQLPIRAVNLRTEVIQDRYLVPALD